MTFSYKIIRSSRKSISVGIHSDNTIIVRCPKNTSAERVEEFLNEKRNWIEKHLRTHAQLNSRFSDVIANRTVLVKGVEVPFSLSPSDYFGDDEVRLTSLSKLKSAYVENLGGEFVNLLNEISAKTNLKYSKISFRSYKSRWGCCDRKGVITFNYKILMLPKDLWVYVIVHELCHTLLMNHSSAFWNCVAACLPDYKLRQKKIKQYSFVCSMYC